MDRRELDDIQSIDTEKISRRRKKRQKRTAGRKKRIVLFLTALIIGVSALYLFSQEMNYIRLSRQKRDIKQQISEEKIKSKELQEEIDNSGSRSYIEYLARKYLKLIYPDEKIYVPKKEDDGK